MGNKNISQSFNTTIISETSNISEAHSLLYWKAENKFSPEKIKLMTSSENSNNKIPVNFSFSLIYIAFLIIYYLFKNK